MNVTSNVNEHELVVVRYGTVLNTKFCHNTMAENNCIKFALEVFLHTVCKLLLYPLRFSKVYFLDVGIWLV